MRLVDNRAVRALEAVMPDQVVAEWDVDLRDGDVPVVYLPLAHPHRLVVAWVGEGFPQDVRSAIESHRGRLGVDDALVLVGRRMSKGAQEHLREQRVSWVDERGQAEIIQPPGLVVVRGPLSGRLQRIEPEIRWTRSTGAVAESLLSWYAENWAHQSSQVEVPRPSELAEGAHWSTPQVARVLQQFDANGWTEKVGPERGPGATRILRDPGALLSAWAGWYRRRPLESTSTHVVWRDAEQFWNDDLRTRLPANAWALSGWLGLAQVAPFMTSIPTITCYLEAAAYDHYLPSLMEAAGLREVETGSRVKFIRAEPHVLNWSVRESPDRVVSNVRLYGDLLRAGVRGEDAAEHLRETSIGI